MSLLNSSGSNTHVDGSGNYYETTDSNGIFIVTGDYNCPSATPNTYVTRWAAARVRARTQRRIGRRSRALQQGQLLIERDRKRGFDRRDSYAVAGYTVDPTHVSTPNTALGATGLNNVGNALDNLYTSTTGSWPLPPRRRVTEQCRRARSIPSATFWRRASPFKRSRYRRGESDALLHAVPRTLCWVERRARDPQTQPPRRSSVAGGPAQTSPTCMACKRELHLPTHAQRRARRLPPSPLFTRGGD